jgi:hypothetical protein
MGGISRDDFYVCSDFGWERLVQHLGRRNAKWKDVQGFVDWFSTRFRKDVLESWFKPDRVDVVCCKQSREFP